MWEGEGVKNVHKIKIFYFIRFKPDSKDRVREAGYQTNGFGDTIGSGSTRPEVKSAPGSTRPESTRPVVFSERSVTYMVYGLFCTFIIFQTKSKINFKQLWTNIAIKLLIDRIGGELVIWIKLINGCLEPVPRLTETKSKYLMIFFTLFQALPSHILQARQLSFSDHWISENGNWSKQYGLTFLVRLPYRYSISDPVVGWNKIDRPTIGL